MSLLTDNKFQDGRLPRKAGAIPNQKREVGGRESFEQRLSFDGALNE